MSVPRSQALIGPRPLFKWATLDDSIFPNTESVEEVYRQVESVYALHDAQDRFEGRLAPGPHAFPQTSRNDAYEWIGLHLTPLRPRRRAVTRRRPLARPGDRNTTGAVEYGPLIKLEIFLNKNTISSYNTLQPSL